MAQHEQKSNPEWDRFTDAMEKIIRVPHSEIKAHLEKEKEAKKLKRTRKSRYRAFRDVNKTD
jgi:predicted GIY-YIG superfamily endonuclease